jgi:hypothetical protein
MNENWVSRQKIGTIWRENGIFKIKTPWGIDSCPLYDDAVTRAKKAINYEQDEIRNELYEQDRQQCL